MEITILTIDDVVPHITTENGICVSERSDYTVIDYVFTNKETFDSDMALQCRGLKFDKDGQIIARPFHKFFNLGEREDPSQIDWSQGHIIQDKLDGTMVHPAMLQGELVFMTRMGMTAHAEAAFKLAGSNERALCADMIAAGLTPMFEYTGPENRVVVSYEDSRLTLLAIREMVSGRYLPFDDVIRIANMHGVHVVDGFGVVDDVKSFVREGRELQDLEGYVVAFDDGHRVKLKADGYVLRHRALSHLHLEKNVLGWVVNDAIDDVIPLLSDKAAERVREYQHAVEQAISREVQTIEVFHAEHAGQERRVYAAAAAKLPTHLRSAAFARLDGKPARESVLGHLGWAAHSQTRIDKVRPHFGFVWAADDLVMPDV